MAGYAIEPLKAPLPTAWNLPFHPDAGSQTSILMSESLVGFNVAATRQNAGSAEKSPPSLWSPGVNAPACTGAAAVMVARGSAIFARLLHEPAWATTAAGAASHASASERRPPAIILMTAPCMLSAIDAMRAGDDPGDRRTPA